MTNIGVPNTDICTKYNQLTFHTKTSGWECKLCGKTEKPQDYVNIERHLWWHREKKKRQHQLHDESTYEPHPPFKYYAYKPYATCYRNQKNMMKPTTPTRKTQLIQRKKKQPKQRHMTHQPYGGNLDLRYGVPSETNGNATLTIAISRKNSKETSQPSSKST